MVKRRDFLKYSGLAAGSLSLPMLGMKHAHAAQSIHDLLHCKGTFLAGSLVPFQDPLPIPPVLTPFASSSDTDWYYLQTQDVITQILPSGFPSTPAWGFNGMMLGPTLRVKRNRTAIVHMYNALAFDPISIHLHGSETPAISDGHPEDLIAPNTMKTYVYPNRQPSATMWYHDHRIHLTAEQVYAGLAGFYILEDDEVEQALNLPKGAYDIPLVIQGRGLNGDGTLCLNGTHFSSGNGGSGIMMVNGKYRPYLNVARRKYRFRILNGDNFRHFTMGIASFNRHGYPRVPMDYFVIATDTGYLRSPYHLPVTTPSFNNQITLAPAERAELVVDFSQLPLGSRAALFSDGNYTNQHYLEFRVTQDATDDSSLPDILDPDFRTLTQADVTDNSKSRRVNLDFSWDTQLFTIDNTPFGAAEPGQPFGSGFKHIADIQAGSVERWWFVNRTAYYMMHPMHVHTCRFQVTRRFIGDPGDPRVDFANPKVAEYPVENWKGLLGNSYELNAWKDTVSVGPGVNAVEVLIQFSPHPGNYVYHCHNLHHEDHDMMANMQLI